MPLPTRPNAGTSDSILRAAPLAWLRGGRACFDLPSLELRRALKNIYLGSPWHDDFPVRWLKVRCMAAGLGMARAARRFLQVVMRDEMETAD